MSTPKILIACIGNIFLGDDAFGCEVAKQLYERSWPEDVRVVDFGIRGMDLAYALLDPIPTVILVDAMPRGEAPGTVYVMEPDVSSLTRQQESMEMYDAHTMHPEKVLRLAASMGAKFGRVLLVGCEPTPFDADVDMQMELSLPVRRAVANAVAVIESLVVEILADARTMVSAGAASNEQNCGAAKDVSCETGA